MIRGLRVRGEMFRRRIWLHSAPPDAICSRPPENGCTLSNAMKTIVIGLCWMLLAPEVDAFSAVGMPKDRTRISAFSKKIVVMDVTAVDRLPMKVEGGIRTSGLRITGKVVEVVRGEEPAKNITHVCHDVHVVDRDAYVKANGAEPSDVLYGSIGSADTGASTVNVGSRYLAIFWHDWIFYVEVRPDDQTWRERILPHDVDNPRAN